MAYNNLLYEVKDGIAYITINRPQVLNALNAQTISELEEAFIKAREDPAVKGVILTGSGEKSFVAGADINELAQQAAVSGKEFAVRGQRVLNLIESMPKPVIAAVNGYALGGGCELAMACHIRIASEKARFGQPEVTLGLIPGYGGTQRLPRLIGKGKALELILTGEPIDAQEAYRIGLVNKVVPQKDLISAAEKMLNSIFSRGPIAVKFALEAVDQGLKTSLEQGLQLEANLFGLVCATEDMKEGTRAFLEKRKPEFKGR